MKRRKFVAFLLAFALFFTSMLFSGDGLVKAQDLTPSSNLTNNEEVSSQALKVEKSETSREKEGKEELENKGKEEEVSQVNEESEFNEGSEEKSANPSEDPLPLDHSNEALDTINDSSKESSEKDLSAIKDGEESKAESNELSTKLYLNGLFGDDNNDGLSQDKALKTFTKAKEKATDNQQIKEIIIVGRTPIEGDISLQGTKAKVVRGKDFGGYLFTVSSGKVATLSNIVIEGNSKNKNVKKSLINVDAAKLYIKNGTVLRNNNANFRDPMNLYKSRTQGGAIKAENKSSLYMQGGLIENNTAVDGGGIYLDHSDLNFSAGSIQKNHAIRYFYKRRGNTYSAGGGICAHNGSSVKISGEAKILKNHSDEIGGGISIGANDWSDAPNSFLMQGGTIDGNIAGSTGGGIMIEAEPQKSGNEENTVDKAIIEAGSITNNKALNTGHYHSLYAGGGICLSGWADGVQNSVWRNGELTLYNAVITDNTSKSVGAAYAAGTISKSRMYVTDGVAIYNNKSQKDASELFIERPKEFAPPVYELSKRMLAGLPFAWKTSDGKLLPLAQYEAMPKNKSLGIHTNHTENKLANKLGKVIISGNYSASRGGGIGSRGIITFGRDKDLTQIKVKKTWKKDNGTLAEKTSVNLIANYKGKDYVIETRDLTKEDHWETTFKYLPKEFDGKEAIYSVKEAGETNHSVQINGNSYKVEVDGNMQEGFTITNTKQANPVKPDKADNPNKPNKPDVPVSPSRPNTLNKATHFAPSKGFYLREESNKPDRFRVSSSVMPSEEKTEEYQVRNKVLPEIIAGKQEQERNPNTGAALNFNFVPLLGIASFLYMIRKK